MTKNIRTSRVDSHLTLVAVSLLLLCTVITIPAVAQTSAEAVTAPFEIGKLWMGVSANGAKASYDFSGVSFFPNDYNVVANTGKGQEAYGGMGLIFTATDWLNPDGDSVRAAVYGPTNDFMPEGMVVDTLRNFIRYKYPSETVDFKTIPVVLAGEYDASKFAGKSFDQLIDVKTQHVFKVNVHRKMMAWSQSLNDNYIICDVELENVGPDTLQNFYMNMNEGNNYLQISSIRNPAPTSGEAPNMTASWLHYYGGSVGDTTRIFYEYSADTSPGDPVDNMGAPALSQGGRLMYAIVPFYTILHASAAPYINPVGDVDDFAQPRVTYIGNITRMPNPGTDDIYGSKNFWAVRGGFSDLYPHNTLTAIPGTHHGINNDDRGVNDYAGYPSGSRTANDHRRYASFGPYTFHPGEKLHFVWASGIGSLDMKTARSVGEQWLKQSLQDAPGLPNPTVGFLPANFTFPTAATENDMRKDRWLSTVIDSAFKSAARAKWNYEHNYSIPQAPPPPDTYTIIGHGDGVEIAWSDAAAEAFDNFAGYRIMRRVGRQDTTYYQEIYSSDGTDKGATHSFRDTTAKVGGEYYYYIQAKALISLTDLSADPGSRGKTLYSNRVLDPDFTKINRRSIPQSDLSKIRVVPNPYNIKDPLLNSLGYEQKLQTLFFINLPPTVTIRIYTENGDLVKHYVHDDVVKTGLWTWDNMLSDNGQAINSGVYIALFETPDGAVSYQKFVVVR